MAVAEHWPTLSNIDHECRLFVTNPQQACQSIPSSDLPVADAKLVDFFLTNPALHLHLVVRQANLAPPLLETHHPARQLDWRQRIVHHFCMDRTSGEEFGRCYKNSAHIRLLVMCSKKKVLNKIIGRVCRENRVSGNSLVGRIAFTIYFRIIHFNSLFSANWALIW